MKQIRTELSAQPNLLCIFTRLQFCGSISTTILVTLYIDVNRYYKKYNSKYSPVYAVIDVLQLSKPKSKATIRKGKKNVVLSYQITTSLHVCETYTYTVPRKPTTDY